jgi:hypothetical protein
MWQKARHLVDKNNGDSKNGDTIMETKQLWGQYNNLDINNGEKNNGDKPIMGTLFMATFIPNIMKSKKGINIFLLFI